MKKIKFDNKSENHLFARRCYLFYSDKISLGRKNNWDITNNFEDLKNLDNVIEALEGIDKVQKNFKKTK